MRSNFHVSHRLHCDSSSSKPFKLSRFALSSSLRPSPVKCDKLDLHLSKADASFVDRNEDSGVGDVAVDIPDAEEMGLTHFSACDSASEWLVEMGSRILDTRI